MKNNKIFILIIFWFVYLLLKFILPFGNYILYPINLIVTFLHEFWHSFFAIITWWTVYGLHISSDWSWLATTSGWVKAIVLMWWYIWSAIFWNILLYIWLKKQKFSKIIIYLLASLMIFISIVWFSTIMSTIILILLWISIILISKYTKYDNYILQFIWVSSVLLIINDFNIWPSSDIAKFSEIFIIIPQMIWIYIWLAIVLFITYINLRNILKTKI